MKLVSKNLINASSILSITALSVLLSAHEAKAEYRDGVDGQIYFGEVCNTDNFVRVSINAKVETREARVGAVLFKMKSRQARGFTYGGGNVTVPTGYNWREVGTSPNKLVGEKTDYVTRVALVPLNLMADDVLVSIHVRRRIGLSDVIDLGGIINLGSIPRNECRTFRR